MQTLKEENKQLRAEVDYLKERKPDGATTRSVTVVAGPTANGNHSDLESRLGRLEAADPGRQVAELRTSVINGQQECGQLRQLIAGLETRQANHEAAVAKALADLTLAVPPPATTVVEAVNPTATAASLDISQEIAAITVSI